MEVCAGEKRNETPGRWVVEAGWVDVMKADIQRAGWTESKNDKINDRKFKVRHN